MSRSLFEPIHEFFTLRRAESSVRAYAPLQHRRIREHADAGDARCRAGRRVIPAIPASVLLRGAITHYLVAALYAAEDAAGGVAPAQVDTQDLAGAMPLLPPDPARPRAVPTDDARVRAAFSSTDPLYFDRLAAEDVERVRWALDRAATLLRRRVEARSVTGVRGARWGRFAAVLVLLGYGVFAVLRATVMPKNIALDKPVHASSRKAGTPDAHELVDGDLGTSVGVHTNIEDSPNVVIDLEAKYWIDVVKVYNRVDGWFDDSLPLVVELSVDGTTWDEIGRREEHFDASPPWIVHGRGKPARFVRLRVARKSYLALSEVGVFGKK